MPIARTPSATGSRYLTLDAWRGIAALAVVGFHCVNTLVEPERSWISALLFHGWAGVYVFFPISGYCILAASHSRANPDVFTFLKRRWRRIFPTYWASIALVIVLTIALAPFSRGTADGLAMPGLKWLSILTLTQTLAGIPSAISPVYWSLCYEEQFYVIVALSMLAAAHARPTILLMLTVSVAAVMCVVPHAALLPGLFVDRWLNFAVGLAVFGWFDDRYGRVWSAAILGSAILTALMANDAELGISIFAALAFVALKRVDVMIAASRPGRLLAGLGTISYSLYLTHVPIAGRIVNAAHRFLPGATGSLWLPVVLVAAAAAVIAAWVFYLLVERRFQNPAATSVSDRAVVVALA